MRTFDPSVAIGRDTLSTTLFFLESASIVAVAEAVAAAYTGSTGGGFDTVTAALINGTLREAPSDCSATPDVDATRPLNSLLRAWKLFAAAV